MINVADPLRSKGTQPVISTDLEQALGSIQKGAEERLEALRSKTRQLTQGETSRETVPVLVGHIKKMEPGDGEEEEDTAKKDEEVGGGQSAKITVGDKESDKGQTTGRPALRKARSTPSVGKINEQRLLQYRSNVDIFSRIELIPVCDLSSKSANYNNDIHKFS